MREHAAAGQEPETVEALGVAHAVAGDDVAVLPVALRAMRLDVAAVLSCRGAEPLQHGVGAGGDEARRHDGPDAPLGIVGMPVHVLDQGMRAREARLRRGVAVEIGALLADCPSPPCRSARAGPFRGRCRPGAASLPGGWWRSRAPSSCRWPAGRRPASRRSGGRRRGRRSAPRAERCSAAARLPAARAAPCRAADIAAHARAGRRSRAARSAPRGS